MKTQLLSLAVAVVLAAHALAAAAYAEQKKQFHYTDDADGRHIAAVEVRASGDGGSVRLRLSVSATGPRVAPVSGFEGVSGGNRFTAEQLRNLLAGARRLTVQVPGAAHGPGRVYAARVGRLPERRRLADGAIDYLAETIESYPLELVIESGPVDLDDSPPDGSTLEILVDGRPRLRVGLDREPATGAFRMNHFESLGPDGAALPPGPGLPLLFAPLPVPAAEQEPVVRPKVSAEEWNARDMEGKWSLYLRSVAAEPITAKGWVQFLVEQKDYTFLEWIGLYRLGGFGSHGVGEALAAADAPQWMRLAVWMHQDILGYGEATGATVIAARPGPALWWFDQYPEAAAADPAKASAEGLVQAPVAPVPAPHLLPPLKAEDVLAHLTDPPADLVAFGGRERAEEGKVYEEQVVRAINGLLVSALKGEPWDSRLRALVRHPNATVRREALLAYTHNLWPAPPAAEFGRVVADPKEPAGVREAALLALSYQDDPMVYATLLNLADDPAHPAWKAAVSRLGDIGDGFAIEHLSRPRDLPATEAAVLKSTISRIAERVKDESRLLAGDEGQYVATARLIVRKRLEATAYVDLACDPLEASLVPWTIRMTREQAQEGPAVRAVLAEIRDGKVKPDAARSGALNDRVKAFAVTILKPEGAPE
jgi:hypothetical protein